MLVSIRWDVDPEIFSIGQLSIRWYGLLFMLSFVFGFIILSRIYRKEGKEVSDVDRLSLYVGLGTLIGARLGHCLFYEPQYFLSNPIEILKVYKGGLASHGALVGIIFSIWLYSRKTAGQSMLWVLDRLVIAVALAGALIRTGNLMNSEIVGSTTDLPWAFEFVRYPEAITLPRHPAQIYEAICYLVIFLLLRYLYSKGMGESRGRLLGWFMILIFSARFLIEFIKANQEAFEENLPLNMGQLLSIPVIFLGIWLVIRRGTNTDEEKSTQEAKG